MFHSSFWQRIVIVASLVIVLVSGLVSFGVLSHPSVAHAANNGQQVEVDCWLPMNWIQIQGTNQNGNYVRWQWSGNATYTVTSWGWWWKGQIFTAWLSPPFVAHGGWDNIPASGSGVYKVNCHW